MKGKDLIEDLLTIDPTGNLAVDLAQALSEKEFLEGTGVEPSIIGVTVDGRYKRVDK